MSYMRQPNYIWTDGESMHIDEVFVPLPIFDELIAMRWAQLTPREREEAIKRAVANYSGNGGCDALCELAGVPGFVEQIEELAAKLKAKRGK